MYLSREDLNGKDYEVVQSMLEGEMVKFADEVDEKLGGDGVTKEQATEILKTIEGEIIKELDDYDKYLDEVEYDLPASVDFNGEHITRAQIAKMITKHICKNEVEWNYALGMYQMVNIWNSKGLKKIKYKPYDSTLRMLGQVKYKGYNDWKEILVINDYASKIRASYAVDTAWLYFLTNMHNYILDKMRAIDAPKDDEAPVEQM